VDRPEGHLSLHGCGTHDQWLDALEQVIAGQQPRCPCCGAAALRLVVGYDGEGSGRATLNFWCDRCLWGLAPNAVDPARLSAFVRPRAEVEAPDYRIVSP
jgi:hypothetical protein